MNRNIFVFIIVAVVAFGCKNKEKEMNNPLLEKWDTPYELPPFEKIKIEHFTPAFHKAMEIHNAEIEAIVNNTEAPSFLNTIEALEYSGNVLMKVELVFENMLSTNSSDEMQDIADKIAPFMSNHRDNISLNKKLFEKVKTVYENKDKENLNREQLRLLEETYKDFVRGGANLPEDKQERFRQINQEISQLGLAFTKNVLDATNAYKLEITNEADLSGLSEMIKDAAKVTDETGNTKWVFTINNPSLLPFLQYADNRSLREEIWRAYSSRCNGGEFDNNQIINKLVNLRLERANMLGYATHADFVLEERMAKTPQKVYDLLLAVWKPSLKKAIEERDIYLKASGLKKLEPWDWRYYTEKIRKEQYNLDEENVRPYFSVDNVRDAVFTVSTNLFGITFKENNSLPKYDPSVVTYEVIDKGEVIAILYMDYYVRPSKSSGAWMTEFRGQHQTQDGKNVIPVVSLVLNCPKPVGNNPSLLSSDETETFFHEFGHGLHGMLSKCRYPSLAGTNVPRDFVEFPSQIMENFAMNKEILKTYAKHYITGEVIPDALIDQILNAEKYGQGFINTELIAASLLDMDYHVITEKTEINPSEFEKAAMQKIGLIDEIISRYRSQYFKHIFGGSFGYSSGYYSYTWSAVFDVDAFELFKQRGIYDQETAKSLRENVFEIGNTDNLMERYIKYRGQEPSILPLLQKRGLN